MDNDEVNFLTISSEKQSRPMVCSGLKHTTAVLYRLLPARVSEQGNVIGSIRIYIYIYMCVQKKIVIERTRDLNYLKFCSDRLLPENN